MLPTTAADSTFKLVYGTDSTGDISGNATADEVQTALEGIIGVGNVSVAGPAGGPWTVTFQGNLENTDVGLLQLVGDFSGETKGQYQLQIRLQQKDEKPGSTIRFADIALCDQRDRSPRPAVPFAAGRRNVGSRRYRQQFPGRRQNIGNLLQVDKGTISVGGQLTTATDVDWYRFDLGFDLMQFVTNYTDGWKTWSTMFDIDYADGLSRPDTTLVGVRRHGPLDPYRPRLQRAGRPGSDDQQPPQRQLRQARRFHRSGATSGRSFRARRSVTSSPSRATASFPSVLDQTFNPQPTNPGVRLEPVESIARVATDNFEDVGLARQTGGETAEFPDNQFVDPNNPYPLQSTLVDTTTVQSLKANVRPFSLADVSLFVSQDQSLYVVDPTLSQTTATATTDFEHARNESADQRHHSGHFGQHYCAQCDADRSQRLRPARGISGRSRVFSIST